MSQEEIAAVTIVIQRADGHHTIRAATPADALIALVELEEGLRAYGLGLIAGPYAGGQAEPATQPQLASPAASRFTGHNPTLSPAPADAGCCPEHGQDKVKTSKFSGGLYCTARTGEGPKDFCQWTNAPARSRRAS